MSINKIKGPLLNYILWNYVHPRDYVNCWVASNIFDCFYEYQKEIYKNASKGFKCCIESFKIDSLKYLLKNEPSIDVSRKIWNEPIVNYRTKVSAFTYCCKYGQLEMCKYLYDCGEVYLGEECGLPIQLACGNGHIEIVSYIISKGYKYIELPDNFAIRYALENNCEEVVKLLYKHFSDKIVPETHNILHEIPGALKLNGYPDNMVEYVKMQYKKYYGKEYEPKKIDKNSK